MGVEDQGKEQFFFGIFCLIMLSGWFVYQAYWNSPAKTTQLVEALKSSTSNSQTIPKQIYTYWEGKSSKIVDLCRQSWKKYAPEWDIVIITPDNYQQHFDKGDLPSNYEQLDSPARKADAIRLNILRKNGGVWCDASVLMVEPFTKWIEGQVAKYSGIFFYRCSKGTEGWFIAAWKDNQFIKEWALKFNSEVEKMIVNGKRDPKKSSVVPKGDSGYLLINFCGKAVADSWKGPPLPNLNHAERGAPYKYVADVKWDVKKITDMSKIDMTDAQLMKFRGVERKYFDTNYETRKDIRDFFAKHT